MKPFLCYIKCQGSVIKINKATKIIFKKLTLTKKALIATENERHNNDNIFLTKVT